MCTSLIDLGLTAIYCPTKLVPKPQEAPALPPLLARGAGCASAFWLFLKPWQAVCVHFGAQWRYLRLRSRLQSRSRSRPKQVRVWYNGCPAMRCRGVPPLCRCAAARSAAPRCAARSSAALARYWPACHAPARRMLQCGRIRSCQVQPMVGSFPPSSKHTARGMRTS